MNYSGSQAESDGEEAIDLSEKSSVSSHAVSAGNDLVYLARLVISDIRLAFVVTEALRQSYERNGQQILAEQAKAMIVALELIQAEAMGHEGFGLFMKDEANFHQTRVLSLVAQRDQRTSLGIATASQIVAKDSRQDVASMIVIAAVTMVLLPGTFMATFVNMPLFDGDADAGSGESLTGGRFWVCWAMTILPTLLTVGVWYMFLTFKPARPHQATAGCGKKSL